MSIKMLLPISAALQRALPAIMPLFGTSFYRRLPTCFRPSAHLVNAFAALHLFEFCASKQNDTLGITSQQVIWIQCWWWRSWRCAQRQIQAPGKPHLWKLPNWYPGDEILTATDWAPKRINIHTFVISTSFDPALGLSEFTLQHSCLRFILSIRLQHVRFDFKQRSHLQPLERPQVTASDRTSGCWSKC